MKLNLSDVMIDRAMFLVAIISSIFVPASSVSGPSNIDLLFLSLALS
jgi:uncharacterized membrane protein